MIHLSRTVTYSESETVRHLFYDTAISALWIILVPYWIERDGCP